MNLHLSQRERVVAAALYLVLLVIVFQFVGGTLDVLFGNKSSDNIVWFFSGALMITMGAYIVEPYFTKPSDAIANSVAVLIALLGITYKDAFFGYEAIFYYAAGVLALSIFSITFKDSQRNWLLKSSKFAYWIVETVGSAKWMFSAIYLSASYSYFARPEEIITFATVIALWILLTFFDVVGWAVKKTSELQRFIKKGAKTELGVAIGCENPFLYRVEIDLLFNPSKENNVEYGTLVAVETSTNAGSLGMVIDKKHLLSKRWLSIYLFRDEVGNTIKIDLKTKKLVSEPRSIFSKTNSVFKIDYDELPDDTRTLVAESQLYKNKSGLAGYVTSGSNINTINFTVLRDGKHAEREISEGAVLSTTIYGKETLYQIINGNTKEEHLENFDTHGYVVGIARKLGTYDNATQSLNVSKWVPSIYAPMFFTATENLTAEQKREFAVSSIGRLPNTSLAIPIKDIHALVTHNTAILGILGIGKSCLAHELMKKVSDENIKIVCIDITNEYKKELPKYIDAAAIVSDDENAFNAINGRFEFIHSEGTGRDIKYIPDKSGNLAEYRAEIHTDLCNFLFGSATVPQSKEFALTPKARIYNVDYHKASKGEKIGYNVVTTELTQAEKTRILAEELFKILMKIPLADEKRAKVLLVFEEAHSLIPEWGSTANDDDQRATNGTAKIILQGRKYGLGSLVITQRTANVSKSILNQCNTIFALRVFDDTGKGFLSNYIGSDYADTLATLEERHAIAIGKALRLKQPVIISLNEQSSVIALPAPVPAAEVEAALQREA